MEFRLLGPLEVSRDGRLVELGGMRQRAALAFLLLHANQVVSTSRLLGALWPEEDAPMTARKILQNAVWRLRGVLAGTPASGRGAELLTRTPGYMVRVRPEQVDLLVFQQRVAAGRAALAESDMPKARDLLGDALSLWRGPVLTDLVEEGTCWPEVAAVQKRRLDVMEDRFDAELACGGHQTVLRDLKAMVEAEPLRERAARQLMLALYRCGRQAEALAVFGRVREALVDGLGLEPSRELRRLQQSILNQDPALDVPRTESVRDRVVPSLPTRPAAPPTPPAAPAAHAAVPAAPAAVPPVPAAGAGDDTSAGLAQGASALPGATGATDGADADDAGGRRPTSVLLLRFGLGPEFGSLPPDGVDRVLDAVTQLAAEKIETHRGTATSSLGSVLLGLFEDRPGETPGAERAVRAAASVRDCLSVRVGPFAPPRAAVRGLTVHAAVASGDAVVGRWPGSGTTPPWIGGGLVDTCRSMLAHVEPGEVHVCDLTRRLTEPRVTYHHACASAFAPWQVHTVGSDPEAPEPCADGSGGQECELDLMRGMLLRTRQRGASHLITVLGAAGRDKTRLLMRFQRRVEADSADPVRVLAGTITPAAGGTGSSAPADMLAAYCGIVPGDTVESAHGKLRAVLARLAGDEGTRGALLSALLPLATRGPSAVRASTRRDVLTAWTDFLALAAREQALVVIWDDLHLADDPLLDAVERLAEEHAGVPLLNVVGADSPLLERRPGWAGGPHTLTISLTPVADDALDGLLASLFLSDQDAEVA
ncbi:BTAD domain-containing putative transcriptional regulator [Streptomyces sp. NPDC047928]|uniref:BTAD domain-containing putative transcriptional regulator n=1 Tax=unclassified Streptomyces TaxID=2593676 RepID=UPI003722B135